MALVSPGAAWLGRPRSSPAQQPSEGEFERKLAALAEDDRQLAESELMVKYGISFDGRRYAYAGYHYDRLQEALQYARMALARGDA